MIINNPACIICHSTKTMPILNVPSPVNGSLAYTLYQCAACDSRFFDPKEHEIDIRTANEKFSLAEPYIKVAFTQNPYWQHQVQVITALHQGKIRSILDCGCRTGDFLMHWPMNIARTGIEVVDDVAVVARSRGLNVINTPLEESHLELQYDVVSCYAILEHLTKPEQVLNALANSVAPSGILALMVPSHESVKARLQGPSWHQYYPPFHLGFFSRRYLDEFMKKRDFEMVSTTFTSGGMFNPFSRIPLAAKAWSKLMFLFDRFSPTRYTPLFDHMYIYYRKIDNAQT
ncbi:class I SAM-dependent methyltransferase [Hydrogenophaga sp. Root209]|uniref:class I SAM-dependent methyltransferase n=1 Tax=Hydrogenophaga sp. Root209 TaxID=1736490 RepID=UPI0009E9DBD1|nr:methyltransferase domain-containing protein [Hydrogenophaga sp. Root209]